MEILKEYLPDLDFSEDILKEPRLEEYIKKEWNELAITFNDPFASEEAPKLDENFGSYFLLCGLPIVNEEKKDKLLTALVNVFVKKGIDYIKQEDITILLGENGESFGTAFIKWEDEKKAKIASATINNFQFGKANLILSTTFDEFERLLKVPEEYVPPKFADLEDLYTYAMDPRNDQFMIRDGHNIVVKLHKVPTKIDKSQKSSNFHTELIGPENGNIIKTSRNPTWSPQGRYLVVLKDNIVQLYGGSNFDLIREIIHTGVTQAQVSPCEKIHHYLLRISRWERRKLCLLENRFRRTTKIICIWWINSKRKQIWCLFIFIWWKLLCKINKRSCCSLWASRYESINGWRSRKKTFN